MRERSPFLLLLVGLVSYGLLILPLTSYLGSRPVVEKLGYVPSVKLVKPLSADQKELAGASLVFKVMMYFGNVVGKTAEEIAASGPADLQGMSRLLHNAVQLDPYNMDAYYFAQSFLTWDARQYKVANELMEYGMKYRTWDWYLPFFAGFNYSFFLGDYGKAAQYYKKAGELSGSDLHIQLAGRYLQQSGQTELAIRYLTGMVRSAKNDAVRKSYQIRLKAFHELHRVELAGERFLQEKGRMAQSVDQLVQAGYLAPPPVDPYGGRFYIDQSGKASTTSKFAFATKNK